MPLAPLSGLARVVLLISRPSRGRMRSLSADSPARPCRDPARPSLGLYTPGGLTPPRRFGRPSSHNTSQAANLLIWKTGASRRSKQECFPITELPQKPPHKPSHKGTISPFTNAKHQTQVEFTAQEHSQQVPNWDLNPRTSGSTAHAVIALFFKCQDETVHLKPE